MALRYLTAGESHGKALSAIIEGFPAGIRIDVEKVNKKLRQRQGGYGRGNRMQIEKDQVEITAGLRDSITLGSPLALTVFNIDWANWQEIMDPFEAVRNEDKVVTRPRPGHADLAGALKYRHYDLRNVLERASARETTMRVAVGAFAQQFLSYFGIKIQGQTVSVGSVKSDIQPEVFGDQLYDDPFYCPDNKAANAMKELVDQAKERGDSLGGVFQIIAEGLPPGLGSHVHWDRKLDGLLAQALMSIPSVKGVGIGEGFNSGNTWGSKMQDAITYSREAGYYRRTNHAGGIEGGLSNGEKLVIRAAVKPIPTLMAPLESVEMLTKSTQPAAVERSDVCVVPAAAIVGETVAAWVLAVAMLDKFGGDHLDETIGNYQRYLAYLKER